MRDVNAKKSTKNQETSPYNITPYQVTALIASTIIGVSVLTLPRSATEEAHQMGWITILLSVVISLLAMLVINKLTVRFPGKTLVGILVELFGSSKQPWIGRVVSAPFVLVYFVYWAFLTGMVVRTFGEVVVTAVLVNTPLEIIVITMLLLCFAQSYYDVEVVARVNEALLLLIVIPVIVLSVSAYQSAHLDFLLPLFSLHHMSGLMKSTVTALTSLFGFEVLLMFNSHLSHERHMLRAQLMGVLLPGMIYLLIVVAGIMAFGYEELSRQAWPTLELVKTTQVPGLVLERLEAVFLGVWVAAVFTTAGNWFYCANWIMNAMLNRKKRAWWSSLLLFGAVYLVAMTPRNVEDLFHYWEWVGYAGLATTIFLPLLFLICALLRRIDHRKQEGGEADAKAAS